MPVFSIDKNLSELYHKIADQFGTPTYVYHQQIIEANLRALKGIFKELPVKWLYAIKANDNPHILKIIANEGFGFDTVSFEEVLLAQYFCESEEIFYTENNMTDFEMSQAIDSGIVLNIGSITRLEKFCEQAPKGSNCSIRIKPDIGDGHHSKVVTGNQDSKFGIRMDKIDYCVQIAKKADINITGIHAHIGSGIKEPQNLLDAMIKLLELAKNLPNLKTINFGGGIPIPYKESDSTFDLIEFEKITTPMLEKFLNEHPTIEFRFEPGRFIVGNAGVFLSHVNTIKDQGNKTYIGLDTGFNHLIRPVLYDSYHHIVNVTRFNEQSKKVYEVAGNICESGDILAESREIEHTHEGDLIAFLDAGAYGMTMASHYNRRALPAEVLINDNGIKQIRRRETAGETVRNLMNITQYTF